MFLLDANPSSALAEEWLLLFLKTFNLGQNRDVSMHECQVRRVRIGAEQYLLQAYLWGRSHLQTYLATTESHHQNAQHCKDVSSFLPNTLPQQVFS